jgi:hypothetical protein
MTPTSSSCPTKQDRLASFRMAALDNTYVSLGSRRTTSPHEFYRYPARFPPRFARAAIEAFTDPGDLVLDPFVGGGTTLVEARLTGRPAIGSDLNPLATFVSRAKARPHSRRELEAVEEWAHRLPAVLSSPVRRRTSDWVADGYFYNIDAPELCGIRTALARARDSLQTIDGPSAEAFARCILLRTGQWALDMRSEIPTTREFAEKLIRMATETVTAANAYRRQVRVADRSYDARGMRRTTILRQALPGLASRLNGRGGAPKLILTSPPYPGVYVNYHRWKVRGRRETPAPFWIADRRDGNGISYYTMAARSDRSLETYFSRLQSAFEDLSLIAGRRTKVVQLVGFHNPTKDLPRYLDAMEQAGFTELTLPGLSTSGNRLWRHVPNRRWWVQDGSIGVHTALEVVLAHEKGR